MKKVLLKIITLFTVWLMKKEILEATLTDAKGKFFKPFNPNCKEIDLDSIALSLSRVKRFFGQTKLSVAQHCVQMARYFIELGDLEKAKEALLHEVGEAFMGDLVTPAKKIIPMFKAIEEMIIKKVFLCYGVNYPMSKELHIVDKRMMVDEALKLMKNKEHWLSFGEPLGIEFDVWSEEKAYSEFLLVAEELKLTVKQ